MLYVLMFNFSVLQVKPQNYPHILVTAGLNGMWSISVSMCSASLVSHIFHLHPFYIATDPRVLYSEPAKFVAKLREMKTDENILLFKCELGAGHFSKSGR